MKTGPPMPVVSITRLRVRSWRYLPMFILRSLLSARQAAAAEGNLATTLLRDRHKAFWTRTIWTTEAAMKSFMQSGTHGKVMRKLLQWCDEAALVRWTQDTANLPTWEEAHKRLQAEGRRSKVNHPSRDHDAYVIAAPVCGAKNEIRWK
jgi:hypothetical protein